jgi:hypothetical protein
MRASLALVSLLCAAGCGGGAPLLHTAQPVAKGDVTMGAGFSGTAASRNVAAAGTVADLELVRAGAVAPGLAPWVGARLGFGGGVDGGLTYVGRAVRLDGRRVFALSSALDLSLGLGATGLLPQRNDALALRVGGQGLDVPLLVGWRSAGDIYSVWLGARGGFEWLRGQRELPPDPSTPTLLVTERITGRHSWVGGLTGLRIGFRHVFALLEVDAAVHFADIDVAGRPTTATAFALAPSGALVAKF